MNSSNNFKDSSSFDSSSTEVNQRKIVPIVPGELSRPTNIQRISQKKNQVKEDPKQKKLEKLAVYSSCQVYPLFSTCAKWIIVSQNYLLSSH